MVHKDNGGLDMESAFVTSIWFSFNMLLLLTWIQLLRKLDGNQKGDHSNQDKTIGLNGKYFES